jgi:hypothetical protein
LSSFCLRKFDLAAYRLSKEEAWARGGQPWPVDGAGRVLWDGRAFDEGEGSLDPGTGPGRALWSVRAYDGAGSLGPGTGPGRVLWDGRAFDEGEGSLDPGTGPGRALWCVRACDGAGSLGSGGLSKAGWCGAQDR